MPALGVIVSERVPTGVHLSAANAGYLATKAGRGAHTLDVPLVEPHPDWSADPAEVPEPSRISWPV